MLKFLSQHLLLPALLLIGVTCHAEGRDSSAFKGISHQIGADARISYIMPTNGFYNGMNSLGRPLKTGGSLHLKYSFSFAEESCYGNSYPSSYQGVGLSVNTLGPHELLGTPVALYLFQGAPIMRISPRMTLDYEWNFGLSFGWEAKENMVVGSKINAYINVGILASFQLSDKWKIMAGPEYTHFSNGDTRFPNGGANTLNFRVGATRCFGEKPHKKTIVETFNLGNRSTSWDVIAYGAWRADRTVSGGKLHIINDRFGVVGMNINPLYHFSNAVAAGLSLDLIYDRSANLITEETDEGLSYRLPSFTDQIAAGLSVRGEISMPIFSINIGVGYNILHKGEDLKDLYGIFALKTMLTDRLFLHIGYRLSNVLYSHNLMFGLGWRFGK